MRITWFGHAAVLVEMQGTRIVMDPYRAPDCGGYAPIDVAADLVVCSHENDKYHSHTGQIRGGFEIIRGLEIPAEGIERRGIHLSAVTVYETLDRLRGDEVTIIVLESQGMKVVHLGDLGHPLEASERAPLEGAHVVIVPAGGNPTIGLDVVGRELERLRPRIVIPVHYLIPGKIDLRIRPVSEFLRAVAWLGWPVEHPGTSQIDVSLATLPEQPRIVVLEPAR
jgi:L-ascorbate metabolism protein UlaG (beta-lactamase superfamily)